MNEHLTVTNLSTNGSQFIKERGVYHLEDGEKKQWIIADDIEIYDQEKIDELAKELKSTKIDWTETKELVAKIYDTTNDHILTFLIPQSHKIKGKIVNALTEYKQQMLLSTVIHKTTHRGNSEVNYNKLCTFDERFSINGWEVMTELTHGFYIYKLIDKTREYICLSEEPLELDMYELEGLIVEAHNEVKISDALKLNTTTPIFFVNKHCVKRPTEKFDTTKELVNVFPNEQVWYDNIFYHEDKKLSYTFPKVINQIVTTQMLSGIEDGYPMHVLLVGPPHIGKSLIAECVKRCYQEDSEVLDAGGSTLKSLVPSFKNTIVQEGHLARSRRVCLIDEYFRIISRSGYDRNDQDSDLGSLNTLMEWKKRLFSSGNGSIKPKMSSRIFANTNFLKKGYYGNWSEIAGTISPSHLSRWLLYEVKDNIKKDIDHRVEVGGFTLNTPIDRDLITKTVLHCQTFVSEFDTQRVRNMFVESRSKIPSHMEDVYNRYVHHILCLTDGLVKLRCITTGDDGFTAIEDDYVKLRELWESILSTWTVWNS